MSIRRSFAWLGVSAVFVAGVACGGANPDVATSARADGLTIVEADEVHGKLVAVFRKDGHEITYEMLLGPKMEDPSSATGPESPSYEVDARILDEASQPFYMQMGGDLFRDASWHLPKVEGFDEARRVADFELARDAEQAWRTATVPAALAELRLAGMDISKGLRNADDRTGKATPVTPAVPTGSATGDNTVAPKSQIYWTGSSVNVWDYQIWKKSAAVIAEHSATTLRGWTSSYSLVFTANSCNHGTCAAGSAMASHCNYSGWLHDDGTHSRYWGPEYSTDTGVVSGGCMTGYGNFLSGYHDCNDDSILQKHAITTDSWQNDSTSSVCAGSPSWYAPACD
ncbi:MAG: hypothetical protein ACXVEE_09435 [Polyangiales bacterium]